jgi:glycogen(starch) synthase
VKILFWTDAFWPQIGGLEVFCVNLIRALKTRGHVCEVITNCWEEAAAYRFEDTAVHSFPFQATLRQEKLLAVAAQSVKCSRIVDRFQPDVVHLHGVNRAAFHFAREMNRVRRPAVLTLHDTLLAPEKWDLARWALENAEQVVAISEYSYRDALARESCLAGRLRVIRNAVPEPEIASAPLPSQRRILGIGTFKNHKGFDLAIDAFARVAAEFPDATLTLAGDGEDRDLLEAQAAESGFGARIHFAGWIASDRIPEMINAHSLVVVPSRWEEPFGLVALEAAQMGRPVIASRSGGLPEIVVDGVTGKLFENGNLPGFADTLRQLLAEPPLMERLGREARSHAAAHFSFNRLVDQYEDVYRLAQDARG